MGQFLLLHPAPLHVQVNSQILNGRPAIHEAPLSLNISTQARGSDPPGVRAPRGYLRNPGPRAQHHASSSSSAEWRLSRP